MLYKTKDGTLVRGKRTLNQEGKNIDEIAEEMMDVDMDKVIATVVEVRRVAKPKMVKKEESKLFAI